MDGVFLSMKSTHVGSLTVHSYVALFAQRPHSRTRSTEEYMIILNYSLPVAETLVVPFPA